MKTTVRHLLVMFGMSVWFFSGGEFSHSQNLPPVIDPVRDRHVSEGHTLNISIHATDPDGDALKISVLNSPAGAVLSDQGTGHASFLWTPEFIGPYSSSGSPFELLFVASDGRVSSQVKMTVNVVNLNRPPELFLPDSVTVGASTELIFQVRAEDPDMEEVRIGAVNLPEGAFLDEDGVFSWIPDLADTGVHLAAFEAVDLSGDNDLKEAHIRVNPPTPCVLSIGVEEALVGGKVRVPINLNNPCPVSGMELLIEYDPSLCTFLDLTKEGTRASEWEYYVYREKVWGFSPLLKVVGIADFPNEHSVPPLAPGSGPVAYLDFRMTSNTQYAGLLVPLKFQNLDFTDNTLSDFWGEFVSREKISFTDGGVLLDAGSTLLGDVNLNGIPFEVGDAVRLAGHLTYGTALNQQQLLNSDVNQDGRWATLADLLYLVARIIQGEGPAPPVEPGPQTEVAEITILDQSALTSFSVSSEIAVGGLLFVFKGTDLSSEKVEWSSEIGEMDLYTHQDGDEFRIMIISTQGKCISPGDKPLFTFEGERDFDSVEVWVSDEEGNLVGVRKLYQDRSNLPLGYALSQNYPNPFNPITRIRYRVGGDEQVADNSAPHISLKVYNLLGQMVKVLVDEEKLPGDYQVFWDGKDESQERVSSGIYFYRFKCNGHVETKKMILLR